MKQKRNDDLGQVILGTLAILFFLAGFLAHAEKSSNGIFLSPVAEAYSSSQTAPKREFTDGFEPVDLKLQFNYTGNSNSVSGEVLMFVTTTPLHKQAVWNKTSLISPIQFKKPLKKGSNLITIKDIPVHKGMEVVTDQWPKQREHITQIKLTVILRAPGSTPEMIDVLFKTKMTE